MIPLILKTKQRTTARRRSSPRSKENKETVYVPMPVVAITLSAILGLQAWTLKTVWNLSTDMASVKATLAITPTATSQIAKHP